MPQAINLRDLCGNGVDPVYQVSFVVVLVAVVAVTAELAEQVHTEILATNPSIDLRVYAIWFNMYPGDQRSKWDGSLLSDPQVTQFWDEKKIVGRWLVERGVVDYAAPILWDAYLLFGPEAVWESIPSPLLSWGEPVYRQQRKLKRAMQSFWPLAG